MSQRPFFTLRRDLGFQLAVLYLVFVGLVLIAAYWFVDISSRQLREDISASDLALAHAIAQETYTTMSSATAAVDGLAAYSPVIEQDTEGMYDIFEKVLSVREDVNLIYRLDSSGVMYFHYPVGPDSTVGVDFSFRPYFQEALLRHEPLFSSGRISPTTNQPVATAVMPIWSSDGEFLGVVAMNIKLQFLSDTLTNIATASYNRQDIEISIVDDAGQIIAHSDSSFLLEDAHQVMPKQLSATLVTGNSGNLVARNQSGQERIYSHVPIQGSGWSVLVSRPTSSAFAVLSTFQRGTFTVLVVFLAGGLFFWGSLSRGVIRPLEKLATLSETIGMEADHPTNLDTALDAFSKRADQMGTLTRSLQQLHFAVAARLNELTTLLKTSTAVVSSLDSQTVLARILAQVEQLLDVQMSAIFVLDEEANVFRVQGSRNLPDWYAQKVMIDPQDPNSVAMRAIRTGEPVQISNTETDPSYVHKREWARMAGYRSIMAIRLTVQHTPSAVLMVARRDPYLFSEREIRLLSSFANHATMAIENAALYARSDMHLQEQTRRLEALIHSMSDGVVLEDSDGYILYANRRVQEMVNLPLQHLLHKPTRLLLEGLTHQDTASEGIQLAMQKLLSDQGIRQMEFDLMLDNQMRHLSMTLFDVQDARDILIGRGWIIEDITQRYAIERMRSILIATVSHELRTPLAAIKGYASTLLADDVEWDAASQHEFLTIISSEVDRLSKLVQDLLDMSRIEVGSLTIDRVQTHLSDLVSSAVQHAGPDLEARLRIGVPSNLPPISVDPQRIETVLRNLLENAVKYSVPDSTIQLQAELEGQQLVVRVINEGYAVSPQQGSRIFERFYRDQSTHLTSVAGMGLGLAIARSFVQVHGGKIGFEAHPNGTCVAFSVPNIVE
ncbi:MAG: GAF domain-containing protein [Anaerolineales bacterium]|nr:GAF domain-containing protein [Anaerolineales bacterium]